MIYLTFLLVALLIRVDIVAAGECWVPLVCDGKPYWSKMETTCHQNLQIEGMRELMKNELKVLTDQTSDISEELKNIEDKLEELKLKKATTSTPETTSEVTKTIDIIGTSAVTSETTSVQETLVQAIQTTATNEVTKTIDIIGTSAVTSETTSVQATQTTDTSEVTKTIDIIGTSAVTSETTSVQETLVQATQTTDTRTSLCIYTYNSTLCYWFYDKKKADKINYTEAVNICENQESEIGQFYNKEIDKEFTNILRQSMPSKWIWIGLRIDVDTRQPTYPSSHAYTRWFPGYPKSVVDETCVILGVGRVETNSRQGMRNSNPSSKQHGVVCQVNTA